jgi:hypothetical protein
MKEVVIGTILLLMSVSLLGQRIHPGDQLTRAQYLQKSKNQEAAAYTLAVGGALLATGGIVWAVSELFEDSPGDELVIIGGASVVGSIPLFIGAKRNNRKAMKISTSLEIQRTPVIAVAVPTLRRSAGVCVKVTF